MMMAWSRWTLVVCKREKEKTLRVSVMEKNSV